MVWCEDMDHEQRQGAALLRLLHLLWLLPYSWTAPEAPTLAWRDELQNHTFLHTMYCQNWSPSIGLLEAYDGDQLFSFNFSQNTRVPRLPEFADWAQKSGDMPTVSFDKAFCQAMIEEIGPKLEGQIPVSRGFPMVDVFTLKPLEFGKPNMLVCFISNLFPPTLTVNWWHHLDPVEGIGPTFVSAVDGFSFQAFSYLNFTPAPSDLFSCVVTHEIDNYTAIAYWVPHDALPSDLLENVLCGIAFGLGMLGIVVGLVLIVYFRKPCSWYIRVSGEGGRTMGATYSGACGGMPKVILWCREACVSTMDILLVGIPVTYIHTYTHSYRITGMALSGRGVIWGTIGGVLGDNLGPKRDQLVWDMQQAGRGLCGGGGVLLMAFLHPSLSSD